MKIMIRMACLVVLGMVLIAGCATTDGIFPPRAGKAFLVNRNEGAIANCRLNQGHRSKGDFITTDPQTGRPRWAEPALMKFEIGSARAQDFWTVQVLELTPYSNYSLFIIWSRFTGRVLGMDVVNFSTSGDPFRDSHTDPLGRKIYADRIVYLPRVETRAMTRFRIHKTWYLAEAIAALVGLR